MAEKRDGVFVWITWLARVMVGEQNCEWASWFKAHYENYDKAASDFDTAKWNIDHTRRLRQLRLERSKLGERVFIEGENAIRLTLPSGVVLAGKPDLITLPAGPLITLGVGQPTIYDVKTGRERCSDRIQVMLYMHLAPLAIPAYAGTRPAGCVVYNGSKVDIPPEAVDAKFIGAFEFFLAVIAGLEPALKVPSRHECRFCDIARTECPARIED